MRIFFYLIGISFYAGQLNAQTNLDSLYSVWTNKSKSDSVRAEAFKKYIWEGIIYSAPDSAFKLAEDLIAFGKNKSYQLAIGEGYNIQGISWKIRGNTVKSLDFYIKSLEARKKAGNKKAIASSFNSLGGAYSTLGDHLKSIKFFTQCLEISREIGDTKAIAGTLGNFGVAYMKVGNQLKALDYFAQSLTFAEKAEDKRTLARSLSYMGAIHHYQKNYKKALEYLTQSLNIFERMGHLAQMSEILSVLGQIYNEQGNYAEALNCIQRSVTLNEEIGNELGVANALGGIGSVYKKQGHYLEAWKHFNQSLAIAEELDEKSLIASALHHMGDIDRLQIHPQDAITKCKRSLKLAEEAGDIWSQIKSCECLYETYKVLGNGNKALLYHEKMLALKDSVQMEESGKHLQQIEFAKQKLTDSLATAEKERLVKEAHEQEVLKQNTIRNYLLGAGSLLFLLSAGFYSRWRYIRKSRDIIAKEKDRSNNLLLNILPEDIAEELKAHGRAEARDFQQVSILFTDFKDFTQTSAKLSAKELVAEINTCFEAFDDIMVKYGIEKIKTIGDAYMAAGGLPIPTEDSIKNTALAALEIQEFIKTRGREQMKKGLPYFEMRVGIHTGPIVAGIVGVKKFQYDVWGDTVNTASRMESSGEVGKVNISQATYDLLKDDKTFSFEAREELEIKGKGRMKTWFVELNPYV